MKEVYKFGEIQHVVIRQQNYVAGSTEKPEVKVFMQTNIKTKPIDTSRLKRNQTVWMKWSGGPIVAKSKIESWHEGIIKNGDVTHCRELTKGTNLYHLQDYWESVISKGTSHYCIILLREEEWLENIIFPETKSYSSSWIYLDTSKKFEGWILSKKTEVLKDLPRRNLPAGLRFKILKRDNFTCQYCGSKAPHVQLHIDHKIPWSVVKKHEEHNLITACSTCNLGKSNIY